MKLELVKVSRRPGWPVWAVLLVVAWLGLGASITWLGTYLNQPVTLCLFKRLTGFACPSCGFTRGILGLLSGRFGQAWLFNPLLFSILTIGAAFVFFRLFFAHTVQIRLTKTERKFAWVLAAMLVCANWVYVILYVG